MNEEHRTNLEKRIEGIVDKLKHIGHLEHDWLNLKIDEITRQRPRTRAASVWDNIYSAILDWKQASGVEDVVKEVSLHNFGEHDMFNNLVDKIYYDTGILSYFSSNVVAKQMVKKNVRIEKEIPEDRQTNLSTIAKKLGLKIESLYAQCIGVSDGVITYHNEKYVNDRIKDYWVTGVTHPHASLKVPTDYKYTCTDDAYDYGVYSSVVDCDVCISLEERLILTYYMAYNAHLYSRKKEAIKNGSDDFEETLPVFQKYEIMTTESLKNAVSEPTVVAI
jgi:hypothetical protein